MWDKYLSGIWYPQCLEAQEVRGNGVFMVNDSAQKTNDLFEHAPVHKAYFKLALPVVLGMVVSLVYNMVDTYFVAQTKNTALIAGVSLCAPVFILLSALGDIFGLGGSSAVSRLFGEKREEAGRNVSGFCFYGALFGGLLVSAVLLVFQHPILRLLGVTQETYRYAEQYYRYMAVGAPAVMVSLDLGNMIRTEGMAMESMIGTVSGSVANIILDPVFIFGLGMGAGGAAIATVLGNLLTDVILIYFVWRKSKKLTVSIKKAKVGRKEVFDILLIGIPASVTNLMQSFSITLTNRYLIVYGADKVAAMGIAMKVNMIVALVMVGFAFGAQPLIGYNYGAKNWERLKRIIRFDLMVEMVFSIVILSVLAVFAPQIVGMFLADADIIGAGGLMIRCLIISAPFAGVVLVFVTVFQAMGKAGPAMVLSLGRQGVFFAVCIVVLAHAAGYYGIICAQAVADVVTMAAAVGLYLGVARRTISG